MTFTVTYAQRDGGGVCLRLAGELDLGTAGELSSAIDRVVAEGHRELLLDLTELTFCDSTGIAAFVRGTTSSPPTAAGCGSPGRPAGWPGCSR
ncbi:STAS domain-containing protein [Micromonospora aurantiaca (nom. illeg.)]|uniref:STAS domain-containing protein n=1 Tax=Micromonospora aurantiaca (nom. illeg.) TaxID=47850 RepID=UPI003DA1E8DE